MNAPRLTWRAAFCAAFALFAGQALAQFPAKPIRVIVPFPAGGPADLLARAVGRKMSESTGQPVIVENRPGADTIIGMEAVARAPADGYTVGYAIGSALTLNPLVYGRLPYDPERDFAPITVIANLPMVLVVNSNVPATNAAELGSLIRSKPGALFYGQGNVLARVATELFARRAGGSMIDVPHKGSVPVINDLVRGDIQVAVEPIAAVLPHVKAGALRALAVTGAKRSAAYPDLPTIAEAGFPGYGVANWHAIVAPAGTPILLVRRLNEEVVKAARHPDVVARVAPLGLEVIAGPPEEVTQYAEADRRRWAAEVKALGIKLD